MKRLLYAAISSAAAVAWLVFGYADEKRTASITRTEALECFAGGGRCELLTSDLESLVRGVSPDSRIEMYKTWGRLNGRMNGSCTDPGNVRFVKASNDHDYKFRRHFYRCDAGDVSFLVQSKIGFLFSWSGKGFLKRGLWLNERTYWSACKVDECGEDIEYWFGFSEVGG